jgi:hypothetical protein
VSPDDYCSHGRRLYGRNADCLECDIVWHEEMLNAAKERVRHHERMLEIISKLRVGLGDKTEKGRMKKAIAPPPQRGGS